MKLIIYTWLKSIIASIAEFKRNCTCSSSKIKTMKIAQEDTYFQMQVLSIIIVIEIKLNK